MARLSNSEYLKISSIKNRKFSNPSASHTLFYNNSHSFKLGLSYQTPLVAIAIMQYEKYVNDHAILHFHTEYSYGTMMYTVYVL